MWERLVHSRESDDLHCRMTSITVCLILLPNQDYDCTVAADRRERKELV